MFDEERVAEKLVDCYCESDLLDYFGIATGCCQSCAQDANAGQDLCAVELPGVREIEVCCSHREELQQRIRVGLDEKDGR